MEGLFFNPSRGVWFKATFSSPEQIGIDFTGQPARCVWKGKQTAIWVMDQACLKDDAPVIPDDFIPGRNPQGLRGPLLITHVQEGESLEFNFADNPELEKILGAK